MRLQSRVVEVCASLEPYTRESWHYLYASYLLSVLMHQKRGTLEEMTWELRRYLPLRENDPAYAYLKAEDYLFRDMFRILFGEQDVDRYFSECMNTLLKTDRTIAKKRGES